MQLLDVSSSATAEPLLQPLAAVRSGGSGGGRSGAARTPAESGLTSSLYTGSGGGGGGGGGGGSSARKPDARSADAHSGGRDAPSSLPRSATAANPPRLQRSGSVHGTP